MLVLIKTLLILVLVTFLIIPVSSGLNKTKSTAELVCETLACTLVVGAVLVAISIITTAGD